MDLSSSTSFLWAAILWGLCLIPLAAAGLLRLARRRSPQSIALTTLDLAARAGSRPARRLIPGALFLLALLLAVVALARPVVRLPQPVDQSAIMLSIDVSGSMLSQDITPSRLEAARAAAKGFARNLPAQVRIGLVTFAGDALLVSPPTDDRPRLLAAIDGITVRHRTAIGEGLLEAIAALPGRIRPATTQPLPAAPADPLPSAAIVLLSDGQNNAGVDPADAAEWARREQVTVYTVGIGDPVGKPGSLMIGGPLDEAALRAIAEHTGGYYRHAGSAGDLRTIYQGMARRIGWSSRPTEVTGPAAAAVALVLTMAVVAAIRAQPLIT